MKYDITGRITQHSMKRIDTLRKRMAVRIPSGPLRAQLTSRESRLQLQNMDPLDKQRLRESMGAAQWDKMFEELNKNG